MTTVRVGILGSCVSRDTFEVLDPTRYDLAMYVARHSVVSTDTDARRHLPDELPAAHAFQRKQMEMDAHGTLWERVDSVAGKIDLFLWDLVDDRHGYVRFPDGSYITRSIDLLGQPALAESLAQGRTVSFGTDEHFTTWRISADRFVAGLRRRALLQRTLLLAVDWASKTTDGEPAPLSMGVHADDANARFARYYDHIQSLGIPALRIRAPLTDPSHRWGAAPFHYAESVYRELEKGIAQFVQQRSIG